MYLCFNIFVLLFLVTPCLIVAVQPCMEWIPIKRKKKKKTNKQCFKASLRKKICFFQKLQACFKSLKLKASFKKMETFVYIYSSFLFFLNREKNSGLTFSMNNLRWRVIIDHISFDARSEKWMEFQRTTEPQSCT